MTNTNQLYVANLPPGTTEDAVRRHFATCGVGFAAQLRGARSRGGAIALNLGEGAGLRRSGA